MKTNNLPTPDWHIFCRVIDNYGDAGISFRLARQLANEFDIDVTLWIDNLDTLAKIQPQVNPQLDEQTVAHITIRHLTDTAALPSVWPNVIIDAFGGGLPPHWLEALAQDFPPDNDIADERKPLWIVLEYLSAEAFVDELHGMSSPPPNIGIPRRFFFPGFTEKSGGLLREKDLTRHRDRFQNAPERQKTFLKTLGSPELPEDALKISLFCYDTPHLNELLDTWNQSRRPIVVFVPDGIADKEIDAWQQSASAHSLHIVRIPFLPQDDYDRLLWLCDLNFVRGEDSLVRAIWAGKPFIWQAYRQKDNAQQAKLLALLARYTNGMQEPQKSALIRFTLAWNALNEASPAAEWLSLSASLRALKRSAMRYSIQAAASDDLAFAIASLPGRLPYYDPRHRRYRRRRNLASAPLSLFGGIDIAALQSHYRIADYALVESRIGNDDCVYLAFSSCAFSPDRSDFRFLKQNDIHYKAIVLHIDWKQETLTHHTLIDFGALPIRADFTVPMQNRKFLLASSRTQYTDEFTLKDNAIIVDEHGKVCHTLYLGNDIEFCFVDKKNHIITAYYDEAYRIKNQDATAVRWTPEGEAIWLAKIFLLNGNWSWVCYAANLDSEDNLWFYYYEDFKLIKTNYQKEIIYYPNISGISGILIREDGKEILLDKGYSGYGRFYAIPIKGNRLGKRKNCPLMFGKKEIKPMNYSLFRAKALFIDKYQRIYFAWWR